MSENAAPIELAPKRSATARRLLRAIRTGARRLHLALALAIVLGVFVQVYLIGAYIFGAGPPAFSTPTAPPASPSKGSRSSCS
jgi:hypothetical protein